LRQGLDLIIDGAPAALVDISLCGAQVISPSMLRPNQRVRVVLPASTGNTRALAIVAWASYEQAKDRPGACYRVGLELRDADPTAVAELCTAHALGDIGGDPQKD
jgi:hypothetical protein